MKNMPDTFSIDFVCLQTSSFETMIIMQLKGDFSKQYRPTGTAETFS